MKTLKDFLYATVFLLIILEASAQTISSSSQASRLVLTSGTQSSGSTSKAINSSSSLCSSSSSSSTAITTSSISVSFSSASSKSTRMIDLKAFWTKPTVQDDGKPFDQRRLAGYEVRYRLKGGVIWFSIFVGKDAIAAYIGRHPWGDYEIEVLPYTTEGLFGAPLKTNFSAPKAVENLTVIGVPR